MTILQKTETLLSPPSLAPESRSTGQPAPKEIPKDPDSVAEQTAQLNHQALKSGANTQPNSQGF